MIEIAGVRLTKGLRIGDAPYRARNRPATAKSTEARGIGQSRRQLAQVAAGAGHPHLLTTDCSNGVSRSRGGVGWRTGSANGRKLWARSPLSPNPRAAAPPTGRGSRAAFATRTA